MRKYQLWQLEDDYAISDFDKKEIDFATIKNFSLDFKKISTLETELASKPALLEFLDPLITGYGVHPIFNTLGQKCQQIVNVPTRVLSSEEILVYLNGYTILPQETPPHKEIIYKLACYSDDLTVEYYEKEDNCPEQHKPVSEEELVNLFLEKNDPANSDRDKHYFVTAPKISEDKISVGSIAIDFIKGKFNGNLCGKNVLIIGVGKVTELVLKYLKKENPNVIFISNRTFERAKELAAKIGAKAVRFDQLKQLLNKADVVISATASSHFLIKKETFDEHITNRLLIIDLALPRDVDPRVREIENIDLFCLEDLDTVIKKNIKRKTQEIEKITSVMDIEVEGLWKESIRSEQELVLLP